MRWVHLGPGERMQTPLRPALLLDTPTSCPKMGIPLLEREIPYISPYCQLSQLPRLKHLSPQTTPIPASQAPYTMSGLSCIFMGESAAIPRS